MWYDEIVPGESSGGGFDLKGLSPILPSLIPGIGGLLSTGLSMFNQARQNRYNDPKRQLQRLNAAGLPFAAFAAGQAGNQSSLPDVSGIQKAGDSFGNYLEGYRQKAGVDLIRSQARDAYSKANMSAMDEKVKAEETGIDVNTMYDVGDGTQMSGAAMRRHADNETKRLSMFVARNQKEMSDIDASIKRASFNDGKLTSAEDARINEIIDRAGFVKAQRGEIEGRGKAKKKIMEVMERGGLNFWEALLIVGLEWGTGQGLQ